MRAPESDYREWLEGTAARLVGQHLRAPPTLLSNPLNGWRGEREMANWRVLEFEDLFRTTIDDALSVACRRLGAVIGVQVVAAAYAAVWQEEVPVGSARVWILRQVVRRVHRHPTLEAERLADLELEAGAELIGGSTAVDAVRDSVRTRAFASLDPGAREVITLLGWTDLKRDQVAELLGASIPDVESAVTRGLLTIDDNGETPSGADHCLSEEVGTWVWMLWASDLAVPGLVSDVRGRVARYTIHLPDADGRIPFDANRPPGAWSLPSSS